MDLSLILLLLAVAGFVGLHIVLALPRVRARLVRIQGINAYRAGYSLQAAVLLVLVILAYRNATYVELWYVPGLAWLPLETARRRTTDDGPFGQRTPSAAIMPVAPIVSLKPAPRPDCERLRAASRAPSCLGA